MKNMLPVSVLILLAVALIFYYVDHNKRSYISFQRECIEVEGSITDAVNRTLNEFPECKIINNGTLQDSKFFYIKCSNTPLNPSNFYAVETKNACEKLSNTGTSQKKLTELQRQLNDG